MKHLILLPFSLFLSATVFCQDALVLKKRIAVAPFENAINISKTDGVNQVSYDYTSQALAITDLLTTELVESGQFEVFERSQINSILLEQGLGKENKVTQQSAVKIGEMLGVEMMVMGSITEYSAEDKEEMIYIGPIARRQSIQIVRVSIDLRVVNTTTGQIVVAKRATGIDSTKTSGASFGGFGKNVNQNSTKVNFNSSKAKAIKQCVQYIVDAMQNVSWRGKVVMNNGTNSLIIKPGNASGVQLGNIFHVYRKGKEIIDPDTGLSLGSEDTKVGEIKITDFLGDGKASKAQIISGTAKKGDIIKLPN